MYSSVNDPDRGSIEPLTLSEIKARVKVISVLPSEPFMDEDLLHPLSWGMLVIWQALLSIPLSFHFASFVMLSHGSCRGLVLWRPAFHHSLRGGHSPTGAQAQKERQGNPGAHESPLSEEEEEQGRCMPHLVERGSYSSSCLGGNVFFSFWWNGDRGASR